MELKGRTLKILELMRLLIKNGAQVMSLSDGDYDDVLDSGCGDIVIKVQLSVGQSDISGALIEAIELANKEG